MRFLKRSPFDLGDDSSAILLLPGWATDYRIFDRHPLGRAHIVPLDPITRDISGDLVTFLMAEGVPTVDIYGWSLGGAVALRFVRQYPEMVSSLTLAGVRPEYPPDELDDVRRGLESDAQAFLGDFYRRCFLPGQREDYRWFKETLLRDYVTRFSLPDLLRGLDCLSESSFGEADLSMRPVTIIHGDLDVVAPAAETADTAARAAATFHLVPEGAHAVFLAGDGREYWPYD